MIKISLKLVPKSPIDHKPALVQVIGLVPNRQQAITWTNDGPVQWRIDVVLLGDELIITTCKTRQIWGIW